MNINGLRGFLRPDTETAEYERMCILAGHPPSAEGGEMKASWAALCFPLVSRRNITGFFVASPSLLCWQWRMFTLYFSVRSNEKQLNNHTMCFRCINCSYASDTFTKKCPHEYQQQWIRNKRGQCSVLPFQSVWNHHLYFVMRCISFLNPTAVESSPLCCKLCAEILCSLRLCTSWAVQCAGPSVHA